LHVQQIAEIILKTEKPENYGLNLKYNLSVVNTVEIIIINIIIIFFFFFFALYYYYYYFYCYYYEAKGDFGEFTLARDRCLRSYFAKRHTCMSVTQRKVSSGL